MVHLRPGRKVGVGLSQGILQVRCWLEVVVVIAQREPCGREGDLEVEGGEAVEDRVAHKYKLRIEISWDRLGV